MRDGRKSLTRRRTPMPTGAWESTAFHGKAEARGAEQAPSYSAGAAAVSARPGVTVGGTVSFSPPALTAKRPS